MFELFVAQRYLRAKRKQTVISAITVISVAGVAAGVMALVIALAISNGFQASLERNLLGVTAHVSILEKEPGEGIQDWKSLSERLAKIPHVASAQPGLYDTGYLNGPVNGSGAQIKGFLMEGRIPDTLTRLKSGTLTNLATGPGELPGIVLGYRMAERMGAVTGKPVDLVIPNRDMTPLGMRPGFVHLRVAGIFETGFYDVDMNWAFMRLPELQKAFGLGNVVNSVELTLDDIYRSTDVASAAIPLIGEKLAPTTWQEQNQPIFRALKMERIVTIVTIGLILLVAALNIVVALVMMVMEKHRDIAILMSMGARERQIRGIFLFEGLLIGAWGTGIGLVLGYTLSFLANYYHWLKLDEQIYSLSYVPLEPRWIEGVLVALGSLVVSVAATLYPARNAARIVPVEALRYE